VYITTISAKKYTNVHRGNKTHKADIKKQMLSVNEIQIDPNEYRWPLVTAVLVLCEKND